MKPSLDLQQHELQKFVVHNPEDQQMNFHLELSESLREPYQYRQPKWERYNRSVDFDNKKLLNESFNPLWESGEKRKTHKASPFANRSDSYDHTK
jgi:hypothetical protein